MANKLTFLAGKVCGSDSLASYHTVDVAPLSTDIGLAFNKIAATNVATKTTAGEFLGILEGNRTGNTYAFIVEGAVAVQADTAIPLNSLVAITAGKAVVGTADNCIGVAISNGLVVDMNGVNVVVVELFSKGRTPSIAASLMTASVESVESVEQPKSKKGGI